MAFGSLVACTTAQTKPSPLVAEKPYKQTFQIARTYMQRCFPGANLRANLYTDIPEGEIILDRLPTAALFISGVGATSSYESAQQIVNLRFRGENGKTKVIPQNELSRAIVTSALAEKACPEQK